MIKDYLYRLKHANALHPNAILATISALNQNLGMLPQKAGPPQTLVYEKFQALACKTWSATMPIEIYQK